MTERAHFLDEDPEPVGRTRLRTGMSDAVPGLERQIAGPTLWIDLDAVVANWRDLRDRAAPARCAAVVKADAYGLGAPAVAAALYRAGCRAFFVAYPGEGDAIRDHVGDSEIYVLNGPRTGAPSLFKFRRLIPVLNGLDDLALWRTVGGPCALHLDTGINRLGFDRAEQAIIASRPELLDGLDLRLVMSHLACADEPTHPMNAEQLVRFRALRALWPHVPASFANSSGIFLGGHYRADLVRPGCGLYGINPTPGRTNPMRPVLRLQAPVLQVRRAFPPMTVGYGASHAVAGPSRLAVVSVGYADGYPRALGGRASVRIAGRPTPLAGRVSMDLTTIDVSHLPAALVEPGTVVEMIGPDFDVDAVAALTGTIGYEVLTRIGPRVERRYFEGGS